MVAQFAKDTKLATLIGQKTAGLVLGSAMFDVGGGYTLYLPVFGWFTPTGNRTEGLGVEPDIAIDIDPHYLAEGNDSQLGKALELLQ
jgi:carboxyl-terminal processing protease